MALKKHNQARSHFSYKNDDVDLVELGQFIRDTTKYRVEREWYVVFDKMTGGYLGYTQNTAMGMNKKIRNPDLILIDRETKKLILIIELDGSIHDVKIYDTEQRNNDYEYAGLNYIILTPAEIKTNIFDLVTKKIGEKLGI